MKIIKVVLLRTIIKAGISFIKGSSRNRNLEIKAMIKKTNISVIVISAFDWIFFSMNFLIKNVISIGFIISKQIPKISNSIYEPVPPIIFIYLVCLLAKASTMVSTGINKRLISD